MIKQPAHGGQFGPDGLTMCSSEAEAIVFTAPQPIQAIMLMKQKTLAVTLPSKKRDKTICLRPNSIPNTEKKATAIRPRKLKKMIVKTEVPKFKPNTEVPIQPKEKAAITMLAENHIDAAFKISVSSFSSSVIGSIPLVSAFNFEAKRSTHDSWVTSEVSTITGSSSSYSLR